MTEKKKITSLTSDEKKQRLIDKFLGLGDTRTYTKALILGDCPKCKERTNLVQLPEKSPAVLFECSICGGILEQKRNGKITYDVIGEAHISINKSTPPNYIYFHEPDEI